MLLHIISLILTLLPIASTQTQPVQHTFSCDSKLYPLLHRIQRLQETNTLIDQVLLEGPLYIKINRDLPTQFDGYWSSEERTIYITMQSKSSYLTTLLFELHNAVRTKELEKLYDLASQKMIEKDKFIERVEYIEHQNVIATSSLIEKGIQQGLYPLNMRWEVDPHFDSHFAYQKQTGHSAWLADLYDELSSANQS